MHSFPGAPLRPALSIHFAGAPIQIVAFIYLNLLTPVVIHPLLFTYRITQWWLKGVLPCGNDAHGSKLWTIKSLMVLLRKCNNGKNTWKQSVFSTCLLNNYHEVSAREGLDESLNLLTFAFVQDMLACNSILSLPSRTTRVGAVFPWRLLDQAGDDCWDNCINLPQRETWAIEWINVFTEVAEKTPEEPRSRRLHGSCSACPCLSSSQPGGPANATSGPSTRFAQLCFQACSCSSGEWGENSSNRPQNLLSSWMPYKANPSHYSTVKLSLKFMCFGGFFWFWGIFWCVCVCGYTQSGFAPKSRSCIWRPAT